MNIFYTDRNPDRCARDHCDKHVVKMLIEYAQLLSTAHHLHGSGDVSLYRVTHKNHPSALWARENAQHYYWLYALWESLSDEYTRRYGRVHASWDRLSTALSEAPEGIPSGDFRDPPQCMPEEYKGPDAVKAYRDYVRGGKSFAVWKHSAAPIWYNARENSL
jgi:hypothetical protein